jgi:hypothetical protein
MPIASKNLTMAPGARWHTAATAQPHTASRQNADSHARSLEQIRLYREMTP